MTERKKTSGLWWSWCEIAARLLFLSNILFKVTECKAGLHTWRKWQRRRRKSAPNTFRFGTHNLSSELWGAAPPARHCRRAHVVSQSGWHQPRPRPDQDTWGSRPKQDRGFFFIFTVIASLQSHTRVSTGLDPDQNLETKTHLQHYNTMLMHINVPKQIC